MGTQKYKVIDTTDNRYIGQRFTIDESTKTIDIVDGDYQIDNNVVFNPITYDGIYVTLISPNFCIKGVKI